MLQELINVITNFKAKPIDTDPTNNDTPQLLGEWIKVIELLLLRTQVLETKKRIELDELISQLCAAMLVHTRNRVKIVGAINFNSQSGYIRTATSINALYFDILSNIRNSSSMDLPIEKEYPGVFKKLKSNAEQESITPLTLELLLDFVCDGMLQPFVELFSLPYDLALSKIERYCIEERYFNDDEFMSSLLTRFDCNIDRIAIALDNYIITAHLSSSLKQELYPIYNLKTKPSNYYYEHRILETDNIQFTPELRPVIDKVFSDLHILLSLPYGNVLSFRR